MVNVLVTLFERLSGVTPAPRRRSRTAARLTAASQLVVPRLALAVGGAGRYPHAPVVVLVVVRAPAGTRKSAPAAPVFIALLQRPAGVTPAPRDRSPATAR